MTWTQTIVATVNACWVTKRGEQKVVNEHSSRANDLCCSVVALLHAQINRIRWTMARSRCCRLESMRQHKTRSRTETSLLGTSKMESFCEVRPTTGTHHAHAANSKHPLNQTSLHDGRHDRVEDCSHHQFLFLLLMKASHSGKLPCGHMWPAANGTATPMAVSADTHAVSRLAYAWVGCFNHIFSARSTWRPKMTFLAAFNTSQNYPGTVRSQLKTTAPWQRKGQQGRRRRYDDDDDKDFNKDSDEDDEDNCNGTGNNNDNEQQQNRQGLQQGQRRDEDNLGRLRQQRQQRRRQQRQRRRTTTTATTATTTPPPTTTTEDDDSNDHDHDNDHDDHEGRRRPRQQQRRRRRTTTTTTVGRKAERFDSIRFEGCLRLSVVRCSKAGARVV